MVYKKNTEQFTFKEIARFVKRQEKFYKDLYKIKDVIKTNKYLKYFDEYIETGKSTFKVGVSLFGEEKEMEYDYLDIFHFVRAYYESKYILTFEESGITHALLEGYYLKILRQVAYAKIGKFESGILSTDLTLMYIATLIFHPNESKIIGNHLIGFLDSHIAGMRRSWKTKLDRLFGFSNICPLASFIARDKGHDTIADKLDEYKTNPLHDYYAYAINNIYSNDKEIVLKLINDMVDFHLRNSKNDLTMPFNHEEWRYFPIEIISLLRLRKEKGLEVSFISNPLIDKFMSLMEINLPIPTSAFISKLRARIYDMEEQK